MLTDEQLRALAARSRDFADGYSLGLAEGYEAMRKRAAEVCRTHCEDDPFRHQTRHLTGQDCAEAIERDGKA